MSHLLISAAHKSSGKTSVTVGIAAALTRRGLTVQPFKKGPDFIDPLWLARAAKRDCHNLDFYTMAKPEILELFARHAVGTDLSLIEGNKGLHDGMDLEGGDSNAALARLLGAPVVLVVDARGTIRGVAPLILGYQAFDTAVTIAGVILNQVGGPRHEGKLRAALEHYTDIPVLGAVQRDPALEIGERHIGLIPTNEDRAADAKISRLADAVSAQVDLHRLMEIAAAAPAPVAEAAPVAGPPGPPGSPGPPRPDLRIAIARDAAFGFYYPGDLEAFATAGAELVPFDTLSSSELPEADGLFLGGGFPENFMAQLSGNTRLRASIKAAIEAGLPAYAECGGLMYLSRSLRWNGERHEMAGVIPGDVVMNERPRGRGYMQVEETGRGLWPLQNGAAKGAAGDAAVRAPARFPAHEFHYASIENLPDDLAFAYRVLRGFGVDGEHDGIAIGNLTATFMHQRDVQVNHWVARFVDFVRACKTKRP